MTISLEGTHSFACQIRALITDISNVSVSDDGLSFEYQRTAEKFSLENPLLFIFLLE